MSFFSWELARNPLNYLVIGTMALVGLLFVSFISAPFRAAKQPAQ